MVHQRTSGRTPRLKLRPSQVFEQSLLHAAACKVCRVSSAGLRGGGAAQRGGWRRLDSGEGHCCTLRLCYTPYSKIAARARAWLQYFILGLRAVETRLQAAKLPGAWLHMYRGHLRTGAEKRDTRTKVDN